MDIKKRIQAHSTISNVAKGLGITQSALSQQINNKTITLEKIRQIAKILNCSVSELVSDEADGSSLTAFVEYRGKLLAAHSLHELKNLVNDIEKNILESKGEKV